METADTDLLITRILENEASPAEVAAFREACGHDSELGRRFARETTLHRLTGLAAAGRDDGSRFAAEVLARLRETPEQVIPLRVEERLRRRIRFGRWSKGLAIAASVALLAGLALFLKPSGGAVLTRCESAVWADGAMAAVGTDLQNGRVLDLRSGLAELRFSPGVSLILEGPARLKITGPKSALLDHGRLVARVTEPQGKGFVVDGPSGRVVDLGTAFGVSVENSGEMEVHVLEGAVNATSNKERQTVVSLHKNEGIRMGAGAARRIPADEEAFVTALPPAPGATPAFIRWSFEETDGVNLANTGTGLAEERAASVLKSARPAAKLPQRVEGRFGKALAFDGAGGFAESGFEGISGRSARTVSLWARIPSDLTAAESYALVGWGNVGGQGSAWQISINPEENEGPLGALRAGTGRAAVVGTTDLRDGKWHHLTAVMYGGAAPSTATHVLLYVDGRLEATTRKSVRTINTEPAAKPHGIWLGRNLSVTNSAGALFFRGELDEVHVFSSALDQPLILRVMENSFPHF